MTCCLASFCSCPPTPGILSGVSPSRFSCERRRRGSLSIDYTMGINPANTYASSICTCIHKEDSSLCMCRIHRKMQRSISWRRIERHIRQMCRPQIDEKRIDLPIRSAVFRRNLFKGVDDSIKSRTKPTDPVVAARWLEGGETRRSDRKGRMCMRTVAAGWPYPAHWSCIK